MGKERERERAWGGGEEEEEEEKGKKKGVEEKRGREMTNFTQVVQQCDASDTKEKNAKKFNLTSVLAACEGLPEEPWHAPSTFCFRRQANIFFVIVVDIQGLSHTVAAVKIVSM